MKKEIKDYVCFDLETTGLSRSAEIIEIGAVKVRNNEIVDTFSELVKPTRRISPEITALTGISQSDVENCRGISEVMSDFLQFIKDEILVGHNIASFDIHEIRRAIHSEIKFEPFYVDTVYLARKIEDICDCKLSTVLLHYGIGNERAHRAFQDCEANHKLFQAMKADGIEVDLRRSIEYDYEEKPEPKPKEHIEILLSEEIPESFVGRKVVLTGEFESGSREEIKNTLTVAGAKVRNAVSPKTDYVIVGGYGSEKWQCDNGGKKIIEAQEMGIKIISEKTAMEVLSNSDNEEENCEQVSLISCNDNETIKKIKELIDILVEKTGYPKEVFSIVSNKKDIGKPSEKLIGYSLQLDKGLFAKTNLDFTKIQCSQDLTNTCKPSGAVEIKLLKSPANYNSIKFDSFELGYNYLCIVSEIYSINYVPSERFGCCHMYEKCSNARKCLASDVFHARGCFYRENIENGKIFYGENSNC